MLVPGQEFIEVKISRRNLQHFKEKGYDCKLCDVIKVKIEDLHENNYRDVEVYCDYCLKKGIKTIKKVRYSKYLKTTKSGNKFCCKKCMYIKQKETVKKRYGTEYFFQTEEYKEKYKQTCKNRYGTEFYAQTEEFKEKYEQTCQEKYGVKNISQVNEIKEKKKQTCMNKYNTDNYAKTNECKEKTKQTCMNKYNKEYYLQTEECQEKKKQTCFKKYGKENYTQTDEYKEKAKQTCVRKYGVDNVMKIKEIHDRAMIAANITKYKNGTTPTSRQQKYICNLLNGELNYPVYRACLDIAFPSEKLYIEYDGSGHNFSVQCGNISQEEFEHNELKRTYSLKNKGWKLIRIISSNDKIPQDDCLLQLINDAKSYLQKGHTWYKIDIDNSEIRCSEYTKKINLTDLRKITEKVLVEQKNNLTNNDKNSLNKN